MKFYLLLLFTFLLMTCNTFAKIEEKASNLKRNKKFHHKNKFLIRDNSTNSTNDTNNTANDTAPLVLNSVGRKVFVSNSSDIVLTKFPFEVSRCDQVVTFTGQFIPNIEEYRGRENGTFTITAHYANLFASSNPDNLLRSVLLAETDVAPRIVEGTGGCVFIFSSKGGDNNIPICLDDETKSQNILEVLKTFSECRGGVVNLSKLDKLKIAHMIKTCSGKGHFVDPLRLLRKLNSKKHNTLVTSDSNWYHPGFNGVPGTIHPTVNGEAPDSPGMPVLTDV